MVQQIVEVYQHSKLITEFNNERQGVLRRLLLKCCSLLNFLDYLMEILLQNKQNYGYNIMILI